MDPHIQKLLNDKVYEKRKNGALGVENTIRAAKEAGDDAKIEKIIDKLCSDYAYAVHQPYARNGGLIGLAAASIALEQDVAPYLDKIIPPVLACFSDQDARVRYYACESMYNIAKTCKGEILPWFNEIFDALAKLSADAESSVKNGAELLDRLIKDIISTSATSYVSILETSDDPLGGSNQKKEPAAENQSLTAFNLARFIPLLQERILVVNPWTRMFLVQWIRLLDEIPDLELVAYLPSFLGGLFRFLKDSNQDVVVATQQVLENILKEIKLVAKVKKDIEERGKDQLNDASSRTPSIRSRNSIEDVKRVEANGTVSATSMEVSSNQEDRNSIALESHSSNESDSSTINEEWIPGQGIQIDHSKILEILIAFIRDSEETVQLTALRWIDSLFDICSSDFLSFVPSLLNKVLPALSSDIEPVQQAASRVNSSLMEYIESLSDEIFADITEPGRRPLTPASGRTSQGLVADEKHLVPSARTLDGQDTSNEAAVDTKGVPLTPTPATTTTSLDYEASVNSLTLQFLNEHEATRVAALSWLIMLQQKAPEKVLAAHDGSFPALLKTLSDPSDAVVTRDLQLLCQISKNSDDSYFTYFMVNLLKLFCTDRRLLEARGNLIVRQLCVTLGSERIYRIMADCIEKDEDVEFASIMVQNLNNILITAPELTDLRKKLRYWDARDGQTLFVTLFRSWCHNAVATISLCMLAQAYEQAYNLVQIFADIEMTLDMLIQIDKLVQLIESPVFVYLRLQLLEPDRYPHLYKCLYGILMLLPQSAAFAALKNRLNAVSPIGYLQISSRPAAASASTPSTASFERSTTRLKSRDDSSQVKWADLLEKFRTTQDRARGARGADPAGPSAAAQDDAEHMLDGAKSRKLLLSPPASRTVVDGQASGSRLAPATAAAAAGGVLALQGHRSRLSASHLGRLAIGVRGVGKAGGKK